MTLAAGLAGCDRAGEGTTAPPAAGTSGVVWSACGGGVECTTLTVPIDHDRPDGPTLDLAVARRPATAGSERRLGSVVVNPGGPGASGVALIRAGPFGGAPLARFDVVSWDPRGVGASRPVTCDGPLPAYRALDWSPDDAAERDALDAGARALAEACRQAAGDLAGHLDTAASARDLDRLRQVLGEDRLTYAGFSYGTALGLHYADRFPERVRAMVLDGVADPREDLATFLAGQARALEAQVTRALGGDEGTYERLRRDAEAGRGPVDPTTLAYAAIAASYRDDGAAQLRSALDAARPDGGRALRSLAEGYWATAAFGAYTAVTCSDLVHPDGPQAYDELVARVQRDAPRFGAVMANELRACAWWPASGPVPAVGPHPGRSPLLLLGNTGDVATPYEVAVRVAGALGPDGALVTYDGEGHTSLNRSTCVDEQVKRYLEDLEAPPTGMRCA